MLPAPSTTNSAEPVNHSLIFDHAPVTLDTTQSLILVAPSTTKSTTPVNHDLIFAQPCVTALVTQSAIFIRRKAKIKFIAENKTRIDSLKDSIKDMKSRGGPGGKSKLRKFQRDRIGKKEGGKIVKASKGSQGKLIGKQKKLDVNKDGKITGSDFEMLKGNRKKYGGKISYRMTGGQVVDSSYD